MFFAKLCFVLGFFRLHQRNYVKIERFCSQVYYEKSVNKSNHYKHFLTFDIKFPCCII